MIKFTSATLVAILLLIVVPDARAGTLDVEILQNDTNNTGFLGSDVGQTFTVGITGDLDEFAVKLGRNTYLGDLLIDLRTTSGGVPTDANSGSNILANFTLSNSNIPAGTTSADLEWVNFALSSPVSVTAGNVLAVVIQPSPSATSIANLAWAADTTDPYAGGERYSRSSGSGTWGTVGTGWDLTLRTYVDRGAVVPLPSAAWAGLGLLSLLGAVRRYRGRRAA